MVDQVQDTVGGGDGSAFASPSRGDTPIVGAQGRLLAASGRLGCFDQGGASPGTALARSAALALTGALVVARCDAGPRCQVPCRGEPGDIGADLRHDHLGDGAAHTGDAIQADHRCLYWLKAGRDLCGDPRNQGIKIIKVGQLLRQEEALSRSHRASQSLFSVGDLVAEATLRQLGERRCIRLPTRESCQHLAGGETHDVAGDRS